MFHGDLLGERAHLTPDREALVLADGSLRMTYRDLDLNATRAALAMRAELHIAKGGRVGLLAHNCVEFVEIFFSVGKSGIILVPLSTRATLPELEGIVRDSGMEALIYGEGFEETAEELGRTCGIERLVRITTDDSHDAVSYRDLKLAAARLDTGLEPCAPDDVYCLLYTSGTTGRPKGVMIPHRMVVWNGYNTVVNWGLREDDRSPIFTPLYHAGALGAFLMPIFTVGGTIILHEKFDVSEIWDVIQREKCSVVLGVPTIWKMLMDDPAFATADLSRVRWFISGGAPLPIYIIDAYQKRGVVFKQGFGMTEVGVNCFSMTVEDSYRKAGTIGRPMMYTKARLLREDGTECARDEVGDLYLKGPHVSAGYWNNPEETAKSYLENGWFRTGDCARRDADGFYSIAGRQKEMFISGGVNVYPAEIEGQLLQHPSVSDAAVIGFEDEKWGEVGAAFVVAAPGETVDLNELQHWLGERLGRIKIPKQWRLIEGLPRTPYGKVEKGKLRVVRDES
jgi:fatty-acyl-CoA synthase